MSTICLIVIFLITIPYLINLLIPLPVRFVTAKYQGSFRLNETGSINDNNDKFCKIMI